jgi:hypothetical protein
MFDNVRGELEVFKKYIVSQSKSNLTRGKHKVTSKLYKSIKADVKVSKNSFEFSFNMDDYGEFLDKGVKGKNTSRKAPQSPFKFGTGSGKKGGLTQGIDKWVKAKGIQFRDKKIGKFLTYKSTAFLITRSIYSTGMKPTLFFTRPFEVGFNRLDKDLVEAFGLDIEEFLQFTLNRE